ncbi:hypothetical protein ACJMK2_016633 [Sinanodonta woodiana]|uniref:AAA+ ATPase domain-containing protein n=1 Tax=Sinanodonta woodiana TaxID=1069815 RepID=A0ABD3UVA2_SINWO
MADKGGTGADIFKLTVKVDLLTKSTVNENGIQQLQKIMQRDISHLRRHLEGHSKLLRSQCVQSVSKEKKKCQLGLEFWLRNAEELEQLNKATKDNSLANALSEFSDKKGLHEDIGLRSEHLCFKCKIEKNHYLKGLDHFMEDSSESCDEETLDDQQQSEEPLGTSIGTESKEKTVFGEFRKEEMVAKKPSQETPEVKNKASFFEPSAPAGQSAKHADKQGAKSKVNQQKASSSAHRSVDFSSVQRQPQTEKTHLASRATMSATNRSSDVDSFVQIEIPASFEKPVSKESSWSLSEYLFGKDKSQKRDERKIDPIQRNSLQSVNPTGAATRIEASDCVILKHFYLYLPVKESDVLAVFMESNLRDLHGKILQPVKHSRHLYEIRIYLNPDIMNYQIKYYFGMERMEGQILPTKMVRRDDVCHILDSSTIQRKFWKKVSSEGVVDHIQHIMQHCKENIKDSILQVEALVADIGFNLNRTEKMKVVNSLEIQSILKDSENTLLFAILIAKLECYSFLDTAKEDMLKKLFQTVCLLNRDNLPSTCIKCLSDISYHVIRMKFKTDFCLIQWMTCMFPFLSEAKFLEEIHQFVKGKKPIAITDEKSVDQTLAICTKVRERILKKESEKGPEFLLELVKHLPLPVALKVHSQIFEKTSDLVDLGEKVVDIIVTKIQTGALTYANSNDIGKLLAFWKNVKRERFASLLTGTFEKHFLALLEKAYNFSSDYQDFCEDEMLFIDGPNVKTLLLIMAKSGTRAIHEYMKTLTQRKKALTVTDDVVEKWFETALDKYIRSGWFSDNTVPMYAYICDAIQLQQAGNNADLIKKLENKLYTMKIKYFRPADLLKMADEIFSTTGNLKFAREIFQHHLERLLKERCGSEDPTNILKDVCGRDLRLKADWQARLVATLLESYSLKTGRPSEETAFYMLPHQNFWKAVLKVQGESAQKVKMHPSYIAAAACLISLRKSLKDETITAGFLEKVASENIMSLVASFLSDDSLSEECCKSLLMDFHSCVIQQRETIILVKTTLGNITKYFPDSYGLGLSAVKEKLHMVDETLKAGNVTIREIKQTLWQPYDLVPFFCKKLQIPSKSNVFWKVCIENNIGKQGKNVDASDVETFHESCGSGISEEAQEIRNNDKCLTDPHIQNILDRDGMPVLEGLVLLKDLCTKGCDLYLKVWEDFYKGNDLFISLVQEIFRVGVNIPEEIVYVEDFKGKSLNSVSKSALLHYWNLRKYKKTVKAMKNSLAAFKVHTVDDEFKNAVQAFHDLAKGNADTISLLQIHYAVKTVQDASCMLSEDLVDLLNVLGKSSTLIAFLGDIIDEDIRNLIDAVEEVSEKYVKESTVSGLIEVKRFLHPFLIKDSDLKQSQDVFFRSFAAKFQEFFFKDAVIKTIDCMENLHNLKSLYNNVANRSERTREIIQNIIQYGNFHFCLKYHECKLTVSYVQKERISTYSKASLIDLRSRALLLMNTARKENDEKEELEDKQDYLGKYVSCIDLALEIVELCTSLYLAGHFSFTEFDEQVQPDQLEECRLKMKEELIAWQRDIMQCREKYYYMNFLLGGQIQAWYNYIQTESIEGKRAADTFLKFIHPNVSISAVCRYFTKEQSNKSNKDMLMNMGKALEQACKSLLPVRHPIELPELSLHMTECIQKGKLLIVSLDENSKLVVRTALGLYLSNTKAMPEAHQILFCRSETLWDEIDLLLKRCMGASKFGRGDSLFCLANVELLSNDNQFQLVDALRKLPKDSTFMLAIIFRGAEHHPFLHEFSDCVRRIHPITEASLQMCLQKECPEVFTVTSDVPGLGKTETIKRRAHQIRKKCVTLHVSGPLSKHILVERLSKLNINKDSILHIDIGNTPDSEELDTLLFEFLLLHYVSVYTTSVFLTTNSVCIELANTMNNTLPNSLHIVTSFKRINITWEGFESFQVSCELHSPLQVVCHYLNAVEDGTLDKRDIIFKGTKALKPLPMEKCIFLIQKYFRMNKDDISYTLINSFVRVLADQLKKLSHSSYFKISNLSLMLGRQNRQTVKTDLVKAMVDVSLDFAGRSIKGCKESQRSTATLSSGSTNLATSLAARVEGMIRWEDSNHLVFLFHSQDVQTLSVLYRAISHVPSHIKTLFESQMKKQLPDFALMNQEGLQDILQKVARTNQNFIQKEELKEMAKYYALTPDNLLKMVLIMLRIRAHIPVIVMGETGCGKTSLIKYLSEICGVDFYVKTIHAGIAEGDIIQTVSDVNLKALSLCETKEQVWLFLDEINTNDHICLLSDIICHHSCLGRRLAPNLVIMAACNPYRLRSESAIHTAGLDDKARTDELSRLLYRVHPLPETMVDYVWDFGSLSRSDEKMYIEQIVCGKLGFSKEKEMLLADALVLSQEFIRTVEGLNCCVSLRDVRRCTDLTVWFKEKFLDRKKKLKSSNHKGFYSSREIEIRAIILALAHCYHSRLIESGTRQKYREGLFIAFRQHDESEYREDKIKAIIREEQQDILDRMELPPGVAKNTSLQENVFVILVCILNRIPIFVVGKPGCSKSLSMQVIRSNLRGPDSKDELFKSLPQLYCVSFQGSESSTSDGIIKVFEKAQKYQESNSQEDVLSVVILDEIGLAEVSRFNPLKVLHSLLEPIGKPHPDVAVVGISNWALDASKMNRAIHLSRPEMDEEELILTGKSISDSFAKSSYASYPGISPKQERNLNISEELKGIASGYFEFVSNQRFRNFFGLRDYYSLVKYFARELANMTDYAINQDVKGKIILKGIQRNFGGLFSEMGLVRKCFEKHIIALHSMHSQHNISVLDLIKENVNDRSARHLLLITTGDSVLGILEKQLKDQGREHVTIYGSKFEEDLTDDYSYRILSRIILCMEQGLVLILKDLETVYGSLYDMLNQNYIVVGNKKNCRIALGPYSNPMCYVHDDFKCIVLVEESELDHSDPPFLNRFEKQSLQYSEILGDENQKVVSELEHWVASVSSIAGKHFTPEDIIPIYSKDMIPSLVLHVSSKPHSDSQTLQRKIEACKVTLLPVMKPEAIVRLDVSNYGKTCSDEELEEVKQSYFQMPIHEGLEHFLESEIVTCTEGVGKMITVFTNSNIHTDLKKIVPGFKCQIEKLGAFKSEKQLTMQMEQFWHSSDKQILFLQCKADTDGTHILLSKSIIEKLHAEYNVRNSKDPKHVCVIVHLGRSAEEAKIVPQIDFLAKWKLVMLDSLYRPKTKLPELRKWNLMETIELKRPLNDYIKEQLFTAFACIRYGTVGRSIDSISHIITEISTSTEFLSFLEGALLKWIDSKYASDQKVNSWQVQVACDANALYTASSFIEALERHILSVIFDPLAMLIYELEKQNLLDSFFVSDLSSKKRRHIWFEFFRDEKIFTIEYTPLPKGPECYAMSTPVVKLHMPFSKLCFDRIEKEKDYFSELLRSTLLKYEVDEVEDLDIEVVEGLCFRFSDIISSKLGELLRLEYENCQMDYVHDFCSLAIAKHSPEDITDETINVMYCLLPQRSRLPDFSLNDVCTFVHTTYWTNFSLIMAEFMFIETCRELVDIKGILQEIFSPYEDSAISYQREDVVYKFGKKTSDFMSASEDCLTADKKDDESKEHTEMDELNVSRAISFTSEIDTRSDSNDISTLYTNDSVSKETTNERQEILFTLESVDAALKQEEVLDGGEKTTFEGPCVPSATSESLDVDVGSDWIIDSVMQTHCNSEMEQTVDEKSLETVKQKNEQEQIGISSTLQNVLVEKLCKKIIPAEEISKSQIELEIWNIKVQNILSLASRVSKDCSILYGLRFCSDLTSLVLIPYNMGSYWLIQLGNFLQRDIAMDTEVFVEKICEMLAYFHSSSVKEQDRQKIFTQFILRCLQAYEDSNVIDWLFHMVEVNAVPDSNLAYLKNPLRYAAFMEIGGDGDQSIFSQILDLDPEEAYKLLGESKFLSSLNSSMENQLETCKFNVSLAAILVDVFEQEICHSEMETFITDTDVERLLKIERIIFTEEFSIRQLVAIAYFRNFAKVFGIELQQEHQDLNQSYYQKLDACLRGNEKDEEADKRLSLQLYLLKSLRSSFRYTKFHRVCQNVSNKLTFLSSLWKQESWMNCTENALLALFNIDLHREARNALESSSDEFKNWIQKAVSDSDQMLSLHSVLIEQFFLKRTLMELTDSERTKANEVERLCKECEVDEDNFRLIQFHLGKNDYQMIHDLNLNLHQGSKESDMQIASFVIVLASLALSSKVKCSNVFTKCFRQPEEVSGIFLFGMEVQNIKCEPNMSALAEPKVFVGKCTSHHRFAFPKRDGGLKNQCPVCSGPVVHVDKNAPTSKASYSSGNDGLVPGAVLRTVSQHLLQMIVYGLLTASLAAGYSKQDQISSFLQRTEAEIDVTQYLYQSLQHAFRCLEELIGIRQTDLDYFLHVLLNKTRTLLWETCPTLTEELERSVWEKEFNGIVSSLIQERFSSIIEAKRQIMALYRLDETAIEHQVEEIDAVGWNPCLFRLTMEPSLENLSLELHQENNADSFPFLALVVKALPQLELIRHIKPLISWHKACVIYASYHKSKADCLKSEYKVSTFIREEDDQKKREMLIKKFDLLKKAWETIREQATSVKALPVMERLHDMSKLENCLILDKSSCMYKVLEVLVSIQNNFLDETLALAVQKYVPALHFLQKNTTCASLPCVPVADIKKDHIINFKWSEHYLKFSQSNSQYGHGRKIAYDFRTIEMELANSLILGKGHLLLTESFPRIIFSDELYKTYILMIQELKGVIPQQKLTSEIEAGVQSRKEKEPKLIADLLYHLGIIISLLRRTGGKPETSLVDFVDNWSCVLTRPFPKQVLPNPENAIQLCHIVELNELLEEMNADGVIESLGDEYRVPLEGTSHTFIDGFLSSSVLLAEVILKAEKRFVHRCLLHREVAPLDSLMNHLKDQYFWPEGVLINGWLQVGSHRILLADIFPADVRVQHINCYLQILMAKIEYLKSKDLRISHGPSTQRTTGKTISKSLAKKKQKKRFNMET